MAPTGAAAAGDEVGDGGTVVEVVAGSVVIVGAVDKNDGVLEMVRSSSSMPPPPVGSQAQLVRVTDGAELAEKVHW